MRPIVYQYLVLVVMGLMATVVVMVIVVIEAMEVKMLVLDV